MTDRDTEYLQQLGFTFVSEDPDSQGWLREFPELGPKFSIRVDREIQRYGISEWRVYLYGFQNKYGEVVVGHSCGHRIPLVGRLLAQAASAFYYRVSKTEDPGKGSIIPMTLAMMPPEDVAWLEAVGLKRESDSPYGCWWDVQTENARFEVGYSTESLDHSEGLELTWFARSSVPGAAAHDWDSPREAFEKILQESRARLQKQVADLNWHRQSVGEIEAKLETAQTLLTQVNALSENTQEAP